MSYAARLVGVWDLATGGKGPGSYSSYYIDIARRDVYSFILPPRLTVYCYFDQCLVPKMKKHRTALNTMCLPGTSPNKSSRSL